MRIHSKRLWFFLSICDESDIAWFHISFGKLSLMWEK